MALGEQVVEDYARLLGVEGRLQREGLGVHLVAERLTDMTGRLHRLTDPALPLPKPARARAGALKRPTRDQRPNLITNSRDFH